MASYKEFKPRKVELQKPIIKEVKKPEKKLNKKKFLKKNNRKNKFQLMKKVEIVKHQTRKVEQIKVLEKKRRSLKR